MFGDIILTARQCLKEMYKEMGLNGIFKYPTYQLVKKAYIYFLPKGHEND